MLVTCVYVEVKPNRVDDFIAECIKNHTLSRTEAGNLRFDILQETENKCKFTLYEAYLDEESAAAHKQTAHYLAWRDAVEPMMNKPRNGIKHNTICPADKAQW